MPQPVVLDELATLPNTQIRALPDVTATETLVYLELMKQRYRWGAGDRAVG